MSEGLTRNHHQTRKRAAKFQNQKNRARRRQREEGQARENRHIQILEQTEACKYDDDPENQDDEKRCWNHVARLGKKDQTGLYQIGAELRRPVRLGNFYQRALAMALKKGLLSVTKEIELRLEPPKSCVRLSYLGYLTGIIGTGIWGYGDLLVKLIF